MRLILFILLLCSLSSKGQIIKASPNYTPFVAAIVASPLSDLLVDSFPSPLLAYSLRKISKSYTGNAVRTKRLQDGQVLDIGFTGNGDLDTVALKTFCGSGNCTAEIFYDQSGLNNDDTASNNSGIFIVKSGVVVRDGGKPSLSFEGGFFYPNKSKISATTISIFTVAKITTSTGAYQRLLNGYSDLYFFVGANASNQVTTFYGNGSAWGITSTQSTTTWLNTSRLVTSINNGNDNQYINGSLISSRNNPMGAWTGYVSIGGVYGAAVTNQLWRGTMSELIIYNTDKSSVRTGIEGNINRYYAIY